MWLYSDQADFLYTGTDIIFSFLPFSGRQHKMTHKGWHVVKPQYNQIDPSKQCRPKSDAVEWGIWSGSTLFATHSALF